MQHRTVFFFSKCFFCCNLATIWLLSKTYFSC